jgi:hypothetical protein
LQIVHRVNPEIFNPSKRLGIVQDGLINFKKASCSERSISSGCGQLNGSITTETEGNIPIRVVFVKEQGAWKIYVLQKPTAGIQTSEAATPNVLDKEKQISMIKQSMHDFAVSINTSINTSLSHKFRN